MYRTLKTEIEKFLYDINKKYQIDFAYLFGSMAKGKERNDSDIDIAIKFKDNYSDIEDIIIRGEIIDNGKKYFDREIDIVSLNKAPILLKYEVVKAGIVIKDSDNRASFESLVLREYFDFKYYSDIYNEKIISNIKNDTFFEENNHGK